MARPHSILLDIAAGRPPGVGVEDPDSLVASAADHRMTGLLARSAATGMVDLPSETTRHLARLSLRIRSHHGRLWDALEVINSRFAAMGITVASFKGITSEARWHDAIGVRPCSDIDLLLDPSDLGRIEEIIDVFQPDHVLRGIAEDLARQGHIQHVDLRDVEGADVDLHFDLLKVLIPSMNTAEVWQRTREVELAPHGRVRVLDPETALIHSLLHLNKDRFSLLLGFVDPVRIVRSEELDWGYIDQFVRREGLEVIFYESLRVVFETLDLDAPSSMSTGARGAIWRGLWGPATRLEGIKGRLSHHRRQFWIALLARGRFTEALARLWRLAFPPKALLDHYHPDTTGPYLWRLVSGRVRRTREREEAIPDT